MYISRFVLVMISYIFIIHFAEVNSYLDHFPENLVVGKGNSTKMQCKSSYNAGKLKWYYTENEKTTDLWNGISQYPNATSYCRVEIGNPGEYNLILKGEMEAAKTYICQEPIDHVKASAELIVIVNFGGNWPPEIEWTENSIVLPENSSAIVPNKNVISTLIVPRNSNNITYTCAVKFNVTGKPQKTNATNIPHLPHMLLKRELKPLAQKSESGQKENSGLHGGSKIGITVGVLAAVVILGSACIVFYKRNKESARL